MIKVDNLSFSFPQKELYKNISFTLEEAQHCAFIGTSGSGKSTWIDILMDPESYMFEGMLEIDPTCKIGLVSQFSQPDKTKETTVFEYIGEEFIKIQNEITSICTEMETSADIDSLLEKYQLALDAFDSIGGEDFIDEARRFFSSGLECSSFSTSETSDSSSLSVFRRFLGFLVSVCFRFALFAFFSSSLPPLLFTCFTFWGLITWLLSSPFFSQSSCKHSTIH